MTVTNEQIKTAWLRSGGNISGTAKKLGLSRSALKERMNKLRMGHRSAYVVTNAVNNTRVYEPFWRSLLVYCAHNAIDKLYVIPSLYKNPSAMTMRDPVWYTDDVRRYLLEEELAINGMCTLMGNVPIQPTAVHPVSALEAHAGDRWAIFGHPQIQMKTIATPLDKLPGMLHTTGSCCEKNYSKSKLGVKARLHHSYGAVVIECMDDVAHTRELIAGDDGVFYDLLKRYSPKGVEEIEHIPALVTGDEHLAVADPAVLDAVYRNKDSLVNTLRPLEIVRPDVLDFYSRNHHHTDPLQNFVKYLQGTDNVREEIEQTLGFIAKTTPDYAISDIVASNHNEALGRWLRETDPRKDPRNARFFYEMQSLLHKLAEDKRTHMIDAFEVYAREVMHLPESVRFLNRRESHLICDIDVHAHGDKGTNGARGSRSSFAKGSYKSVIQHSHSPGIDKGAWQVGTLTGTLDYEMGLSSHLNSCIAIYPNGKRSFYHIINGRFRP